MSITEDVIQPVQHVPVAAPDHTARPSWLPVLPALCMIPAGISWLAGGLQFLNDLSWIAMTLVCAFFVILELKAFPRRLGVGGLVLFTGVLGWFCWDYLLNWSSLASGIFTADSAGSRFTGRTDVVAKATFAHMLFITMATIGLLIPWGWWLPRLIAKTPQPADPHVLLTVIVALFAFSLLPYVLFTNIPWYQAIWESITTFTQPGKETVGFWTVGRTGHLNVSWGGYVAFWIELGTFAAVLAVFYALFMARSWPTQALCWSMWLFAVARTFASGSRGELLAVFAPLLAMVFIRYQTQILGSVRRMHARPLRAYVVCLALLPIFYGLMQLQGYNRYTGSRGIQITEARLDLQDYVTPQGNAEFSNSMMILELVPKHTPHFYNRWPGEGWIRPIPQTAFEFVVSPIPRALWRNKPVDQAANWFNMVTGGSVDFGAKGATMAQGLVGWWWLRYGLGGVVEGGLFFGWLLLVIDRAILLSRQKPLILIISLALAAFMFRSFRDLQWMQLNDFIVGIAALWVLSLFTRKQRIEEPTAEYP